MQNIRKGFNQIYTYTQQYNEPFGYLLIYKIAEEELRFSLMLSSSVPQVVHNNKTIYHITVDIYPYSKPMSQRPPLKTTNITETELISVIEEEENN